MTQHELELIQTARKHIQGNLIQAGLKNSLNRRKWPRNLHEILRAEMLQLPIQQLLTRNSTKNDIGNFYTHTCLQERTPATSGETDLNCTRDRAQIEHQFVVTWSFNRLIDDGYPGLDTPGALPINKLIAVLVDYMMDVKPETREDFIMNSYKFLGTLPVSVAKFIPNSNVFICTIDQMVNKISASSAINDLKKIPALWGMLKPELSEHVIMNKVLSCMQGKIPVYGKPLWSRFIVDMSVPGPRLTNLSNLSEFNEYWVHLEQTTTSGIQLQEKYPTVSSFTHACDLHELEHIIIVHWSHSHREMTIDGFTLEYLRGLVDYISTRTDYTWEDLYAFTALAPSISDPFRLANDVANYGYKDVLKILGNSEIEKRDQLQTENIASERLQQEQVRLQRLEAERLARIQAQKKRRRLDSDDLIRNAKRKTNEILDMIRTVDRDTMVLMLDITKEALLRAGEGLSNATVATLTNKLSEHKTVLTKEMNTDLAENMETDLVEEHAPFKSHVMKGACMSQVIAWEYILELQYQHEEITVLMEGVRQKADEAANNKVDLIGRLSSESSLREMLGKVLEILDDVTAQNDGMKPDGLLQHQAQDLRTYIGQTDMYDKAQLNKLSKLLDPNSLMMQELENSVATSKLADEVGILVTQLKDTRDQMARNLLGNNSYLIEANEWLQDEEISSFNLSAMRETDNTQLLKIAKTGLENVISKSKVSLPTGGSITVPIAKGIINRLTKGLAWYTGVQDIETCALNCNTLVTLFMRLPDSQIVQMKFLTVSCLVKYQPKDHVSSCMSINYTNLEGISNMFGNGLLQPFSTSWKSSIGEMKRQLGTATSLTWQQTLKYLFVSLLSRDWLREAVHVVGELEKASLESALKIWNAVARSNSDIEIKLSDLITIVRDEHVRMTDITKGKETAIHTRPVSFIEADISDLLMVRVLASNQFQSVLSKYPEMDNPDVTMLLVVWSQADCLRLMRALNTQILSEQIVKPKSVLDGLSNEFLKSIGSHNVEQLRLVQTNGESQVAYGLCLLMVEYMSKWIQQDLSATVLHLNRDAKFQDLYPVLTHRLAEIKESIILQKNSILYSPVTYPEASAVSVAMSDINKQLGLPGFTETTQKVCRYVVTSKGTIHQLVKVALALMASMVNRWNNGLDKLPDLGDYKTLDELMVRIVDQTFEIKPGTDTRTDKRKHDSLGTRQAYMVTKVPVLQPNDPVILTGFTSLSFNGRLGRFVQFDSSSGIPKATVKVVDYKVYPSSELSCTDKFFDAKCQINGPTPVDCRYVDAQDNDRCRVQIHKPIISNLNKFELVLFKRLSVELIYIVNDLAVTARVGAVVALTWTDWTLKSDCTCSVCGLVEGPCPSVEIDKQTLEEVPAPGEWVDLLEFNGRSGRRLVLTTHEEFNLFRLFDQETYAIEVVEGAAFKYVQG